MSKYDVEVQWLINDACNFHCTYCWLQNEPAVNRTIGFKDTQRIIDGFDNQGATWLIHMSGGEPFLFPDFIELCLGLTKKHFISINTNLTHREVERFAANIDPKRVEFIHASLHILERKGSAGIKGFIDNYQILKKAGFRIFASYLMYPSLLGRFEQDYAYFKSQGIILHPKVFRGYYGGRFILPWIFRIPYFQKYKRLFKGIYPKAYSAQQKKFIKHSIEESLRDDVLTTGNKVDQDAITIDLSLDKILVDGKMSFKGKRCSAGRTVLKMEKDGGLYRCMDEAQYYLGNMFSGPINLLTDDPVCNAETCSCPYVGMRCTY